MSITPQAYRFNLKHLPYVTIALIVINLMVFFLYHWDDRSTLSHVLEEYQASGLYQYEKDRYRDYLEKHRAVPKEFFSRFPGSGELSVWGLFLQARGNAEFHSWLKATHDNGERVEGFSDWQEKRLEINDRFEAIAFVEFGLMSREWNPLSLISHLFFHAGLLHLLSNLLFLGLLGLMTERVLGHQGFLGLYLISGMVLAYFALQVDSVSLIPGVGTSAALSGLLGLSAVIFGHRQITLLPASTRYAEVMSMPVYGLLPLWVSIESVHYVIYFESQLNYIIQLVGLLLGAITALLVKKTQWYSRLNLSDEATGSDDFDTGVMEAKALIRDGEFKKALGLLRRLYRQSRYDRELLSLYYQSSREMPESRDFHRAAHAIFRLSDRDLKTVDLICETYRDYIRLAEPAPRLNEKILFRLADLFVDRKRCDEVDKIMQLMRKRRAACLLKSNLPYRYAKRLDEQGRTLEGTEYLKSII
jgi:membrane associated rhomboid family serine protease